MCIISLVRSLGTSSVLGGVGEKSQDASHAWWFEVNGERLEEEEKCGIKDGF